MPNHHLAKITVNFFATLILIAILALPLLFATNFTKIAGVKNQSKLLVISQIDKFPNLTYSQTNDIYKITFEKQGPSQAFLQFLIINNPTDQTQTYSLEIISGEAKVFFGEDLDNQISKIAVPGRTSVPVSIYSNQDPLSQTLEFKVVSN